MKKDLIMFLAFVATLGGLYLGVLFGLVYTAVKVVKYAWQ
jgi:hypothetical protein